MTTWALAGLLAIAFAVGFIQFLHWYYANKFAIETFGAAIGHVFLWVSVLVMGAMLIGLIIRWYLERQEMGASFDARPPGAKSPESRRLWWLAEQEAKVLVSKLEKEEGKRMSGEERKEVTRRLFREMKDQRK